MWIGRRNVAQNVGKLQGLCTFPLQTIFYHGLSMLMSYKLSLQLYTMRKNTILNRNLPLIDILSYPRGSSFHASKASMVNWTSNRE